ncbi:hypothetical protein Nepgr_011422 [Nepenthes gracilis]|uniref:Uncharacterized protein n=1 Tax=Nepenthes gracilis TaxID=150966 RepID=A0AAD3SFF5_NEPGR|nr:hypothetical protein Nepgr_011422 [Nepenthes gracilis]
MVNNKTQVSGPARGAATPDQDYSTVSTLTSRREGQKKKISKKTRRLGNTQALEASHAQSRPRVEGRLDNRTPEESPKRRNPRYFWAKTKHQAQEGVFRIVRSTGGSSRSTIRHAEKRTELRTYLNSKRIGNTACTNSRVKKILNRVFKDNEHTIDLDRSPFTA